MNNIKYFIDMLESINIELNNEQINQFGIVYNQLIDWNQKINLTAITEDKDIIAKHFIDSLVPNVYIGENSKIIDVGTGAGFPGIPLKILRKDISLTLIDTVGKKVNYLKNLIEVLNLNGCYAIHSRAEDLANNTDYREKYDVAVSRALANMSTLVEYLLPFVKVGGQIICMKGPNLCDELETAQKAIKLLGGKVRTVIPYSIKEIDTTYNLVIIDKINQTPSKYPRKAGMPSKNPLI